MTGIDLILSYSRRIDDGRTKGDTLHHLMEEVGELATEVRIVTGKKIKAPGPDGVIGEAVDTMICALDQIYQEKHDITEAELMAVIKAKCEKWVAKVHERAQITDERRVPCGSVCS